MKTKRFSLFSALLTLTFIVALLFACAWSATAQTVTNSPPQTFFQTATGYFTTFNASMTNTFSSAKHVDIWTGAEQNLGNNTAADLGIELTVHRFANATNAPNAASTSGLSLSVESVTKNAGIAGTILGTQAGAGISYTYLDTKLTAYVDGGYDFANKRMYAEPGLRVKKALTDNTFMGLGISLPLEKGFSGRPNLVFLTGFTF